MKRVRQGLIMKVLLLCFAVYAAVTLLSLTAGINERRDEVKTLELELRQQSARTEKQEADLQSEQNRPATQAASGDQDGKSFSDEQAADIARDKLGLVFPDEKVFYIVNK